MAYNPILAPLAPASALGGLYTPLGTSLAAARVLNPVLRSPIAGGNYEVSTLGRLVNTRFNTPAGEGDDSYYGRAGYYNYDLRQVDLYGNYYYYPRFSPRFYDTRYFNDPLHPCIAPSLVPYAPGLTGYAPGNPYSIRYPYAGIYADPLAPPYSLPIGSYRNLAVGTATTATAATTAAIYGAAAVPGIL